MAALMNFDDEQIYRLVMERRDRSSGWRSNRWLTEWRPTERSQREERERVFALSAQGMRKVQCRIVKRTFMRR